MTTRRRAREIVVQLLYEDDLNPEQSKSVARKFLAARLNNNKRLIEFSEGLWENVLKNRWDLDKAISAKAANWSIRRMAAIDRNILRLGAFELLHTDTPGRVVINEAVELAKRYGDKQSGQFVNGILDRLLHEEQTSDSSGEVDSSGAPETESTEQSNNSDGEGIPDGATASAE